jgi:uncharacterized membrane protein
MIETAIRLVLTNIPVLLFVAALVFAWRSPKRDPSAAEHYLNWLLFLSIGLQGLWAGFFHVLAPHVAASFIGWQVSPFQFEIGIADIALGITAMIAFWRPLEFKTAIVIFVVVFYAGLTYGHVREIVSAGNFAAGNAGLLLALTILQPFILVALLFVARRSAPPSAVQPSR